jgi:hypothetical protein
VYALTPRGVAWRGTKRERVAELIATHGSVTGEMVSSEFGCSLRTANYLLRELWRQGVLCRLSRGVYGNMEVADAAE